MEGTSDNIIKSFLITHVFHKIPVMEVMPVLCGNLGVRFGRLDFDRPSGGNMFVTCSKAANTGYRSRVHLLQIGF